MHVGGNSFLEMFRRGSNKRNQIATVKRQLVLACGIVILGLVGAVSAREKRMFLGQMPPSPRNNAGSAIRKSAVPGATALMEFPPVGAAQRAAFQPGPVIVQQRAQTLSCLSPEARPVVMARADGRPVVRRAGLPTPPFKSPAPVYHPVVAQMAPVLQPVRLPHHAAVHLHDAMRDVEFWPLERDLLKSLLKAAGLGAKFRYVRDGRESEWSHTGQEIGKGGQGTVYKASKTDDRSGEYAVKVLPKAKIHHAGKDGWEDLRREIYTHLRASCDFCPHVIKLHEVQESHDSIKLFMEKAKGDSLAAQLNSRQFSVVQTLQILHAAAQGLIHFQRLGIVHRDVKSENLMVEGNTAKWIDFGVATDDLLYTDCQLGNASCAMTRVGGTPGYICPEHRETRVVNLMTDVYSFGIVILEMMTRRPPCNIVVAPQFVRRFPGGNNFIVIEYDGRAERFEVVWCEMARTNVFYPLSSLIALQGSEDAFHKELRRMLWRGSGFAETGYTGISRKLGDLARRCIARSSSHRPNMNEVASLLVKLLAEAVSASSVSKGLQRRIFEATSKGKESYSNCGGAAPDGAPGKIYREFGAQVLSPPAHQRPLQQLQQEEARKRAEEARKAQEEARKAQEEARKPKSYYEEARKAQEEAHKASLPGLPIPPVPDEGLEKIANKLDLDSRTKSKQLGEGKFYEGEVAGSLVAIKEVLDAPDKAGFLREVQVLSRFRHPNVVSLIGFARGKGQTRYLVYEKLKMNLRSRLKMERQKGDPFPLATKLKILFDVALGLSHLHCGVNGKEKVFHRNIKTKNIMIDNFDNAKLVDFGTALLASSETVSVKEENNSISFTEGYADPLYIKKGFFTERNEVYSFGMVILEVLTGRPPAHQVRKRDGSLELQYPHSNATPDSIIGELASMKVDWPRDLVCRIVDCAFSCIAPDEERRPSFEDIVKTLKSEILQSVQG